MATYPRQDSGRGRAGSDRDLNPAVVHDGLVIVAPSDASAIFAFDADSGRLVWKTDPIPDEVKLAHLLGVAKGRLVATGDRVLLFDVKTGKLRPPGPTRASPRATAAACWPATRSTGRPGPRSRFSTRAPASAPSRRSSCMEIYQTTGGNLVAGDGYLIVAQTDALVVFCQNSRLIERYRDEIARNPEQAATYYRLARAAEAVGHDQLALESLRGRRPASRSAAETIDGVPLADAARDHQFRLLIRLAGAERSREASSTTPSHGWKPRRGSPGRTATGSRARLLLADVELEAGRPADAVEILEQLARRRPAPRLDRQLRGRPPRRSAPTC